MANFRAVNAAVKKNYPKLDIEVVRGNGYVYFCGNDGFDKLASVYTHPVCTLTETLIRLVLEEIAFVYNRSEKEMLQPVPKVHTIRPHQPKKDVEMEKFSTPAEAIAFFEKLQEMLHDPRAAEFLASKADDFLETLEAAKVNFDAMIHELHQL